jgi:outer membrane protein assembly factor BamB
MRNLICSSVVVLCFLGIFGGDFCRADDSWPQWGGPHRDHRSSATGLKKEWLNAPELVWQFDAAGFGYSSLAVVEGKAYTLGRVGEQNCALCLDALTGKLLWQTALSEAIKREAYNQNWGGGPRSTPTVVGSQIFVLDDGGTLAGLEAASGKILWKVNLKADFGGTIPKWGYSESPLVDGNRVVVCPGGSNYLVALDINTGKQLFSSSGYSQDAHYVSLMKVRTGTVDSYVGASEAGLVAFSATDGSVLWTNRATGNSTATVATPIVRDNLVYHTSNYGAGCVLMELNAEGGKVTAQQKYANKNMQNHHGGVVLHDNNIFGSKKGGGFVCQDFESGEVRWSQRLSGDGSTSVIYADQRLYVFGEGTGSCYLIDPSPSQWVEKGKLTIPEQSTLNRGQGKIWTHPTIADGKLFLRDLDLVFAFDIRE